ncbi:hypothetical protein WJS89_10805 [Sphingomicrobium sp. XHP0235]|uniref:hypothetical protein n=1 Tax=Sphingomicrobium aquimarinum TaxID=3133971 RepID=UPI0031FF2E72
MRLRLRLLAVIGTATLIAAPAAGLPSFAQLQDQDAQPRPDPDERQGRTSLSRDQDRAFDRARSGRALPLSMIERQIVPRMRGFEYLGPEARGDVYRFKFLRDGRLHWIDVDQRSGRVVDTSSRR